MNKNESADKLKFAIKMAKQAGKILLSYQKKIKGLKVSHKHLEGVFSKADLESEKLIIRGIKKKFPDHFILAEESAFEDFKEGKDGFKKFASYPYSWIIDPLDGTSNFLNQFDYYSVCICLAHFGKPIIGVVYRPSNKDLFFSVKGQGSIYLKGKRAIPLRKAPNKKLLKDSLLITGFSSEKGQVSEEEFDLFRRISSKARGVRRLGSAALDMCYVASGVFDGFWEGSLAPWDVSASGLICQEAGVKVTDYKGLPFSPFSDNFLVARLPLYRELKTQFKG